MAGEKPQFVAFRGIASRANGRQHQWTESIAVGGKRFVEELKTRIGIKARGRLPRKGNDAYELKKPQSSYGLSFDPKNDALRPENTYFWGEYSDKAVG